MARPCSHRLSARAQDAVVWGPLFASWFALSALPQSVGLAILALSALGFLIGVPWTILRPTAGPHDRLTGTRVVPR